MRSLESLNEAVGTVLGWNPAMSMENLDDEAAALDVRIQASGLNELLASSYIHMQGYTCFQLRLRDRGFAIYSA